MRKITECRYIESYYPDILSEYVTKNIQEGFVPKGKMQAFKEDIKDACGIDKKRNIFVQKMVKYGVKPDCSQSCESLDNLSQVDYVLSGEKDRFNDHIQKKYNELVSFINENIEKLPETVIYDNNVFSRKYFNFPYQLQEFIKNLNGTFTG